jgi:hypothetical protein
MKYLALGLIASLVGCAAESPVVPTGKNTYMVSVVSHNQFGNPAIIKATALANQYCENQGRGVVVTETQQAGTQMMSSSSAQVQFECLDKNDPAYKGAQLRPDRGVSTSN